MNELLEEARTVLETMTEEQVIAVLAYARAMKDCDEVVEVVDLLDEPA